MWNLIGRQLAVLKGHQGQVTGVEFSEDSKLLATASIDGTARVWNLKGQQLAILKGHLGPVYLMKFSRDSKLIATASIDGTVRLWNLKGQMLTVFKGHQSPVYLIEFSAKGHRLAIASVDGTGGMWNLKGQLLYHRVEGDEKLVVIDKHMLDQALGYGSSPTDFPRQWRTNGLHELLDRGCYWLKDYLTSHPEARDKLKVCQKR